MKHSSFITRIHNYVRNSLILRKGVTKNVEYSEVDLYKEYPRMVSIQLPKPKDIPMFLHQAINKRISNSTNVTERALSLSELGTLLGYSIGMRNEKKRYYPSGGALYPIETYLIGNVIENYPSGVFHYHPKNHALEFLWETPSSFTMSNILPSPDISLTPQLIVFTSVWNRSAAKYGDHAYSHSLLEAGHMAQNILLVATALSMGTRPLAGYNDKTITELLNLDETLEQPVYTIALCPEITKSI